MPILLAIILFGLLMSFIALIGGITLILREEMWQQLILPLVAFAAGSLIGGAIFHMIPGAVDKMGNVTALYVWLIAGFIVFYALEEFLHWHHSHTHSHQCNALSLKRDHQHPPKPTSLRIDNCERPECTSTSDLENAENFSNGNGVDMESPFQQTNKVCDCNTRREGKDDDSKSQLSWLILVADAVHNFLGGMFVGASFLDSMQLGISAWLAAAAHEVPQELGDFAILVHGGWTKQKALLFNFASALTFPIGGVIAYLASKAIDVSFMVPFAAGNFLYIGASDLIPEIKHHHGIRQNAVHFASFLVGAGIMLGIRVAFAGW